MGPSKTHMLAILSKVGAFYVLIMVIYDNLCKLGWSVDFEIQLNDSHRVKTSGIDTENTSWVIWSVG